MSFEQDVLSEAVQIGYDLADDAVLFKDSCAWVGRTIPDMADAFSPGPVSRTLDPSMYGGTSGIGWFFADLHQITGEPIFEDMLQRTMRNVRAQILSALELKPQDRPTWASTYQMGYYTGLTGALAFLARGHALFGTQDLPFFDQIISHLAQTRRKPPTFDLMAGQAGAIPALLSLSDIPGARQLATRYTNELIRNSRSRRVGVSWRGDPDWHDDLVGLSHGASGAAYALSVAANELGIEKAQVTADAALAYESNWFLDSVGNWPDLRTEPKSDEKSCRSYWCHGAPGIGLARLATGGETDQRFALERTQEQLNLLSDNPGSDHGLCHGLMGLVEIETTLSQQLGAKRLGPEVISLAIDRYGHESRKQPWLQAVEWPMGVPGQRVPGLFKGIAGVGHALLHAIKPEIPTVLLPATPTVNPITNLASSSHKAHVPAMDVTV